MITWWVVLFTIGVLFFVDTFFGVGDMFRQFISAVFILASLGLLARIARKTRSGEKEMLIERIAQLERELSEAGRSAVRPTTSPSAVDKSPVAF